MFVEDRRKCGFGKTRLTRCSLIPSILFSLSRERERERERSCSTRLFTFLEDTLYISSCVHYVQVCFACYDRELPCT